MTTLGNKFFFLKPSIRFLRSSTLIVTLFILAACGYHAAGSGHNRLAAGQSLWVSYIRNESDNTSVQTVLRRAILDECHALRGLYPSGEQATADYRIQGTLRSYSVRIMSYTALDQAREYRLTLEVDLELYRKCETVPFWKGTLQSHQDYPADSNLALQRSAEEAALATASQILARKFLMSVEQDY
jgi:outer membrane lipopolysaccharide assembly protein LptE/RlpB